MTNPSRRKTKPKAMTESLDSASRKVGPLSIFGISDFWRVPTILPKTFLDLSDPITDFSLLVVGQSACIGGTPVDCSIVDVASDGATADGTDAEELTDDEERTEDEAAEPGEGDGDEEDSESAAEEVTEGEGGAAPARLCRFDLLDLGGQRRVHVQLPLGTKANEATADAALAGRGMWLYGEVVDDNGRLTLQQATEVAPADLNEVQAYYPSRTRKAWQPGKTKGGRKSRKRGRWIVRRMSSTTTGVLVRDKNRFAIARCATALRDRLGLASAQDEWALMKAIGSPALTLAATLKLAHTPPNISTGMAAAAALQRLTALEVLQQIIRERDRVAPKRRRVRTTATLFARAVDSVVRHGRITPSAEQRLAAAEILADLASDKKTERMLSGDVGSGKTVVFGIVAACVHWAGHLVVVLEPRSQLAEQVYERLRQFFPDIPMQLIAGATAENEAIKEGIVVGTTGVWSRLEASGCSPALIVADEQQKFGVSQRCPWEHADASILESTATPIPRTQGLIEFGGIRVSTLRSCHVQKQITTEVVTSDRVTQLHDRVYDRVVNEGLNLILVFPRIDAPGEDEEEDDKTKLPASEPEATPVAVAEAIDTWNELLPGRVGVIHGRMMDEQRSAAIAAFQTGKHDVIISTSILEVGVDFKRADMMVIHHPERFGLAAVHQLRGRLARQGGQGWCYLACGSKVGEAQLELLKLMEQEQDGFKLALADMRRRGFGDLRRHAHQQSGDYEGFLVDRPPTIEDLDWAEENCRRWLGDGKEGTDLLRDDTASLRAVRLLAEPRKPTTQAPVAGETDQPARTQYSLFDDEVTT